MEINFAKNLKLLRTENNLSQTELAQILSVNQRTISNWENDIRRPDYEMLVKIALYFDVSIEYLLDVNDKN